MKKWQVSMLAAGLSLAMMPVYAEPVASGVAPADGQSAAPSVAPSDGQSVAPSAPPAMASTTVTPTANYKGEIPCPPRLVLNDGFYFGAAAGYDSYRIVHDAEFSFPSAGTAIEVDPRFNVTGAVGGALLGFGHYFSSLHDLYLAFEIFGNGSAAEAGSHWYVNSPSVSLFTNYNINIEAQSNYGLSLLPGIKLNNTTLFYVRLGYNWSDIDVNEYVLVNDALISSSPYDVTVSGFNYGLGLETALVPNVSLRGEYTHTDYSDFSTYLDTKVSPQDNQFMMALIFHFG